MDVKTRLENEELFGSQPGRRVIFLNTKKIFTVEDFINCDINQITASCYTRRYYMALQHALKYKYKGEPLALDVLLDREYQIGHEHYKMSTDYDLNISEAKILGFEDSKLSSYARRILKSKMIDNDDYYPTKNGRYKQDFYTVSIIEILDMMASKGDKLAKFYVDYKRKKGIEENQQDSTEYYEKLKSEIILLTVERDKLDKKILELTEQLNALKGEKTANER